MPELPDRKELEAEFAKRFGNVATRHGLEFAKLLGDPPDILNVPAEFWEMVERESAMEAYAILLLLFNRSTELHGWTGSEARMAGYGWAHKQSQQLGTQWAQSTQATIVNAAAKRIAKKQRTTPITPESIDDHRAANRSLPAGRIVTESDQGVSDRISPPWDVLDESDVDEIIERGFGPSRVARTTTIETTRARGAAGEIAVGALGQLHEDDIWINPADGNTCLVCWPLIGTGRSTWIIAAPDGPPPIGSECSCRCGISYRIDRIRDGLGDQVPQWSAEEWRKYWEFPEMHRRMAGHTT
jgi:hypothetical protein